MGTYIARESRPSRDQIGSAVAMQQSSADRYSAIIRSGMRTAVPGAKRPLLGTIFRTNAKFDEAR